MHFGFADFQFTAQMTPKQISRFEKKYYNAPTYNNLENGCRKGFKYLYDINCKIKLKIPFK